MIDKLNFNDSIKQINKSAINSMRNIPDGKFQLYLDEAMEKQQSKSNINLIPPMTNARMDLKVDQALLAQVYNPDEVNLNKKSRKRNRSQNINEDQVVLDITPFQFFIDKSVNALKGVSQQQFKVNQLIEDWNKE